MAQHNAGEQLAGWLIFFLMLCCPFVWPLLIMMLIFGGLSGRYRKPPSRSGW